MRDDPTIEQPATPLPKPRTFERLAEGGSDLSLGCWMALPVATGMVAWPYLGVPLGILAAIGAWWRVAGLLPVAWHRGPGVDPSSLARAWLLVAVVVAVAGCLAMGLAMLSSLGLDLPWVAPLRDGWRAAANLELLLGAAWIAREAVERSSTWAAALMGAAAACLLVSGALQVGVRTAPDALLQPRALAAITMLGMVGCGSLAIMLVADGAGRVLSSMSSDSLDAENEADATSPR